MNKVKIFSELTHNYGEDLENTINAWINSDAHDREIIVKQVTHSVAYREDSKWPDFTVVLLYDDEEGPVKVGRNKSISLPRFGSWDDVTNITTDQQADSITWLQMHCPNGLVVGDKYKVK